MPHVSISKQHAKGTTHHRQSPNTAWGFQCRGAGLEKAVFFFLLMLVKLVIKTGAVALAMKNTMV